MSSCEMIESIVKSASSQKMGFSDFLLHPFQKWLKAPILETPFSTIELPRLSVCMSIIFVTFFFIYGGFVFCQVRGIPLSGYARGRDGKPILTWIEPSLSSQFLAEGIISSIIVSCGALTLISAAYLLQKDEPFSEMDKVIEKFTFTAPIWCFGSFIIFNLKIPPFFPSFGPR